jgi:hypothetical protein
MRVHKSYLLAGSRYLILLGFIALSLLHAALGLSPASRAAASEDSRQPDFSIGASHGDGELVVEVKAGRDKDKYLIMKFYDVIVSGYPRIDLGAMIEGEDADRGTLPYALAWLAGDKDPVGTVRALGYDIEVRKLYERPCTDQLPGQTCVDVARRLATLIDATLGFGSPDERARFRQDASKIGIAPDCSPRVP